MDLGTQSRILELTQDESHRRDLVVLLGSPDPESAELAAMTVVSGDPTFAGPLAGVQLGLPVYHILEPEVRDLLDEDVYQEQVGLMASVLEPEAISKAVAKVRDGA